MDEFELTEELLEEEEDELEAGEEGEIILATVTAVSSDGVQIKIDGDDEGGEKYYKVNSSIRFLVDDRVKIHKNSGTYLIEYVVGSPMGRYPIPSGGSDGQVLTKDGASNYAVKWMTLSLHGIPSGGSSGQVLAKSSGTDYSVGWVDAAHGLPTGGAANQVLAKNSATNYDVKWADAAHGLPSGGSSGQVLTKNSATNYDVKWAAAPSPTAISNGSYTVSLSSGGVLYPSSGNISLGSSSSYWYNCYIKGSMRFGDSTYSPNAIGFFGKTPVSKQTLYSSSTLANVITLLQNYGLA